YRGRTIKEKENLRPAPVGMPSYFRVDPGRPSRQLLFEMSWACQFGDCLKDGKRQRPCYVPESGPLGKWGQPLPQLARRYGYHSNGYQSEAENASPTSKSVVHTILLLRRQRPQHFQR